MGLQSKHDRFIKVKNIGVKPDFIIAGAMKSGTTSVHKILNEHPGIFIPNRESVLFSVDDIDQNPVFFRHIKNKWTYQSFDDYFEDYVSWHNSLYDDAEEGQTLGQDAPRYLPSKKAIDRISKYIPGVKILILLRDPVDRVYSHYWHWVRTYRAIYSLEDSIQFRHGNLLQRSFYEDQIKYCFNRLSRDQIKIVLFERFINNRNNVIEEIIDFLNVDNVRGSLKTNKHSNKGKYPSYVNFSLWRNFLCRNAYGRKYFNNIDWMPDVEELPYWQKAVIYLDNIVNPYQSKPSIDRNPETEQFLSAFLYDKNSDLDVLVDMDLGKYWPTFRGKN